LSMSMQNCGTGFPAQYGFVGDFLHRLWVFDFEVQPTDVWGGYND
jgi:hypothetical protein